MDKELQFGNGENATVVFTVSKYAIVSSLLISTLNPLAMCTSMCILLKMII